MLLYEAVLTTFSVADDKKDLIYYITKGDVSKATDCIQKDKSSINNTDDQGLAGNCIGSHFLNIDFSTSLRL